MAVLLLKNKALFCLGAADISTDAPEGRSKKVVLKKTFAPTGLPFRFSLFLYVYTHLLMFTTLE